MAIDPSLISVEQAREFCGVRGNAEDRFLGELVRAASHLAEAMTDRKLKSRTYSATGDEAAEVFNGNGSYRARLAQSPVTAVSKIEFLTADNPETWEEQSLTTYPITLDPSTPGLIFYRAHSFPRGFRNVRASYTAGYVSPYPDDLVTGIRELVLALYKQKDKQLAGVASRTFEGQTVVYDQKAVPDQVKLLFQRFVRMEFA